MDGITGYRWDWIFLYLDETCNWCYSLNISWEVGKPEEKTFCLCNWSNQVVRLSSLYHADGFTNMSSVLACQTCFSFQTKLTFPPLSHYIMIRWKRVGAVCPLVRPQVSTFPSTQIQIKRLTSAKDNLIQADHPYIFNWLVFFVWPKSCSYWFKPPLRQMRQTERDLREQKVYLGEISFLSNDTKFIS